MKLTRRALCRLAGDALSVRLATKRSYDGVSAFQDTGSALHHLDANERFGRMLRLVPAALGRELLSAQSGELYWFDAEERMRALGFSFPESFEDESDRSAYVEATRSLLIDPLLARQSFSGDLERLLGFGLPDVRQTLSFIGPDGVVRLVAGAIDEQSLTQALLKQGYSIVAEGGHSLLSLSAEPDFDLSTDIGQIGLGSLNNAAMTSDGVLAFAGRRRTLIDMLDSDTGEMPSLADDAGIQLLLENAGVPLSGGLVLSSDAAPGEIAELDVSFGEDSLTLVGFASGSFVPASGEHDQVPGSTMVLIVETPDQNQSMSLAKRVLLTLDGNRLSLHGLEATDLFAGWDVRLTTGGNGVRVALQLKGRESLWSDLIMRRELGLLFGI